MIIHKIQIGQYRVLQNQSISFSSNSIFPVGAQIIGLIGANGSGKTTFCSLLAIIFQSIATKSKVDFEYHIEFSTKGIKKRIQKIENKVSFYAGEECVNSFICGLRIGDSEKKEHSEFIKNFWSGLLILSTFETRGEYPGKKPSNYAGYDPLIKFDVAQIYGKNIFGYPSYTKGIIRFLKDDGKTAIAQTLFNQMNLKYTGEVELKITRSIADGALYRYYRDEDVTTEIAENLEKDGRIKIISEGQILKKQDILDLYNKMTDIFGRYIFLNGLRFKKDGVNIGFDELSSGEKFLLVRYMSILSAIEMESIIIIEEPENHLNPMWREVLIPALHKMATAYNSMLIFTTHDYRVIRYLHNSNVYRVNKGRILPVSSPTLLCDEYDFEELSEKSISVVFNELTEYMEQSTPEKIQEIIHATSRVAEKQTLRKKFTK